MEGEETPRAFDRVIWATGTETIARPVVIEGAELFEGQILHGQAYKR
jgi:dimethylaniline monooxygenase (N-oxide forming)